MKISIFWIPVYFWILMVMVYNGALVGDLLVEHGVSKSVEWTYRILSVYAILVSTIYFCYNVLRSNIGDKYTKQQNQKGHGGEKDG